MKPRRSRPIITLLAAASVLLLLAPFLVYAAEAGYGDVVMNNFSEQRGIGAVVFPHSIHRVHFRCNVCHEELGFAMKAGANRIEMANIIQGQYCGACHNGRVTWTAASCERCHVGKPAP